MVITLVVKQYRKEHRLSYHKLVMPYRNGTINEAHGVTFCSHTIFKEGTQAEARTPLNLQTTRHRRVGVSTAPLFENYP